MLLQGEGRLNLEERFFISKAAEAMPCSRHQLRLLISDMDVAAHRQSSGFLPGKQNVKLSQFLLSFQCSQDFVPLWF